MHQSFRRQTVTFVVRVWAEYLEREPSIWRGEIVAPNGEHHAYFHSLDDITTFIETHAFSPANEEKEQNHGSST